MKVLFTKSLIKDLATKMGMDTSDIPNRIAFEQETDNFKFTPEEIVHNWIDNVKLLYGIDLSNELHINEDTKYISIHCYKFCMNELKESIYGDSQELNIEFPYRKH